MRKLIATALLAAGAAGCGSQPALPLPGIGRPARTGDPFAYVASRARDFETRAVAGSAQVVFLKSPGGVLATAARVAAFRPLVERAAAGSGIDPNVLEAIVFLESAGRPDALAGSDPSAAAGLTQILAQTGQSLLGMHIDLASSRKLLAQLDAASGVGDPAVIGRLQAKLARADERFEPLTELRATVRYLRLALARFGREDLAVESYHMGIGNLQSVLDSYDGGQPVPYPQLFFDSFADHNSGTFQMLQGFGDDSRLYWWRVLVCEQIMQAYRTDPPALARWAALETATDSTAFVLHPPGSVPVFADSGALRAAYAARTVLPLPSNAAPLGLAYSASLPRLYRGLRPAALDLLIELAARVRALSGTRAPLIVVGAVTDKRYGAAVGAPPLSATGYAFSIARRYASRAQAEALQAMLDRLQSLNVIAWTRTAATIDVTVASDASRVIVDGP